MAGNRSASVHTSTPASPTITSFVILTVSVSGSSILRIGGRTCASDLGLPAPMSQSTPSPVEGPVERRVEVAPGIALHVEERIGRPDAAPFVLVHGLASNVRLWDGVAERLHTLGHT